jgi:hypothetical protein
LIDVWVLKAKRLFVGDWIFREESGVGVTDVYDFSSGIHQENTRGVNGLVSFTGAGELLVGC